MTINEAKKVLEEQGYILDEFFPFKGKKKEEIDPALYTLPGGQRKKRRKLSLSWFNMANFR